MRDWNLEKSGVRKGVRYLTHCGYIIAKKRDNGTWYCSACGKPAPVEIQFVANLAGCEAGKHADFTWDPR